CTLKSGNFVATPVHNANVLCISFPERRDCIDQRGIRLNPAAEFDDGNHNRPAVSSRPSIRFAFCIACPAAPFVRLSIAAVTMSVGEFVLAALTAEIFSLLVRTTSRRDGVSLLTSMKGSPSYAER